MVFDIKIMIRSAYPLFKNKNGEIPIWSRGQKQASLYVCCICIRAAASFMVPVRLPHAHVTVAASIDNSLNIYIQSISFSFPASYFRIKKNYIFVWNYRFGDLQFQYICRVFGKNWHVTASIWNCVKPIANMCALPFQKHIVPIERRSLRLSRSLPSSCSLKCYVLSQHLLWTLFWALIGFV